MKNIALLVLYLLIPLCIIAEDPDKKQYLEIKNRSLALKQDLTRGGAICYISKQGKDRNLVNIFDEGRYIQQSYYAGNSVNRQADGQSSLWSPWPWNPIQVGDYARNRAQILEAKKIRNSTYVKCIPMLWDMRNKPAEAIMEQWTSIRKNIVHVKCRLTCHRTDSIYSDVPNNHQEIPAVYPISSLNHLYFYQGNAPFTGEEADTVNVEELSLVEPKHGWGYYREVPEKWMAFVDDNGWGMGVYSPLATEFLAGRFRSSRSGEAYSDATSYIAPVRNHRMEKNSVVEYEYYIIIGTVAEIQSAVYQIRKN